MEQILEKPKAMKKVCNTVIGGIAYIFYITNANSIPVVNADDLKEDTFSIVYENEKNNIYASFSDFEGISCNLSEYTFDNYIFDKESMMINDEMIKNYDRLEMISELEDGWDGEDAKSFDIKLIERIKMIISSLKYQPEIFPTACETIQLEYDHNNGAYLEFEIGNDDEIKVFSIDENGNEESYNISDDKEVCKVVDKFYG